MPRVIHFEIHADDPQRAVKFYSGVFGWDIQKWTEPMDYWLLMTGKDEPGINGAIVKREKPLSGSGDIMAFVCTISIDSVEKYSSKIEAGGGKILVPKGPIPGIGWFAQCLDTEGNVFGILQNDPSAK